MENTVKKGNAFSNNAFVKMVGPQRMVVFLAVIALYILFASMSSSFRQYTTLVSLLENSYYISFMAIGVTFCLITGGVDLSIGTGMICYSLMGAFLVGHHGMPVAVGLLVSVLAGVLVGVFNGFLVAVLDLPPFIATLCTMMITRGGGSLFTGSMAASWPPPTDPEGAYRSFFRLMVDGTIIPTGFIYVILAVCIMSFVLNRTRVGRYIIGVGSNKEALRLSGVNVVKWQWIAYVISGLFAGLAAVSYAGIMQSSIGPGSGAGLELNAIGGAIIGGTSMKGGEGSIFGTLLGVFVMVLLQTGLPYIGLQANWQQIVTGFVLIIAVTVDVYRGRKR